MRQAVVLPLLLAMACACMAGMVVTYAQITAAERRKSRTADRVGRVMGHRAGDAPEEVRTPVKMSVPTRKRSPVGRIAAVVGADLSRKELYPFPWWLAVPIAAVPGKVAALLLSYLIGGASQLAVPLITWVACRKIYDHFHQKQMGKLFKQLPDALAMVVRAVRVGIPISEALRVVAREGPEPTKAEFMKLSDQILIGVSMEQALRSMAERTNVAEYRFFATAISLQAQTGGGISETLESLADVIRKRSAAKARGKALAAEARASALALSILPLLSMLSLYLLNPGYIAILFDTDPGHKILAGAALLLAFGTFVMRTIIQKGLT